jgi:hypothetical protein
MSIRGLAPRIGAGMGILVAFAVSAPSAGAATTVINPGPVEAVFDSGRISVASFLTIPFTPSAPVTASGSIAPEGTLAIAGSDVRFPPLETTLALPAPGTVLRMQVVPLSVSGNLDPSTGRANLGVNVRVDVTIGGATSCTIGTDAAPVPIALTTSSPGRAYNPADGSITLFSNTWPVPGLSNCTGPLAGSLGVLSGPVLSPAGGSTLRLGGHVNRAGTHALIAGPAVCVVPKLKGVTLASAKKALKLSSCKLGQVKRRTSSKKRNTVLSSSPKVGKRLPAGSAVDLVVSKGPAKRRH